MRIILRGYFCSEDSAPSSSPQQRESKRLRHEGQPSTSTGVTYKQTLSAVKMAITLETYPETRLSEEQSKKIQLALTREIWRSPAGEGPQIINSYAQGGVLFMTCANSSSRTWLLDTVPRLQPWEEANLRVGDAKDVVKTFRVVTWVPTDDLEIKEPKQILQLLEIQNKDLKTEDWRILNSKSEKQGLNLVLAIAENSLKDLAKRDFKAFVGLKEITFRPNKNQKRDDGAAGNTNKPAA